MDIWENLRQLTVRRHCQKPNMYVSFQLGVDYMNFSLNQLAHSGMFYIFKK